MTRKIRRRGYTEGVLTDENGKHLADTLEPQWRALARGEKKVPGFEGIRMHAGNNAQTDSRGCILLGERNGAGMIINSRVTVRRVTEMLMRERKISITIKIKEQ